MSSECKGCGKVGEGWPSTGGSFFCNSCWSAWGVKQRATDKKVFDPLPPGLMILTASYDKTAKIWCARTKTLLRAFRGHDGEVMSAVVSPEKRRLLTASYDGYARIWCLLSGVCLQSFEGADDCGRGRGGLYSAVFSRDGSTVLTASADGVARLWKVADGTCQWMLRGHEDAYMRCANFSPSEEHFVSAGADMVPKLWRLCDQALETSYYGHTGWVNTAVFSSTGDLVLTSSADKTARLWRTMSGDAVGVLRGHSFFVRSAVFTPGEDSVLTCSSDWTAKLWNIETLSCIRTFCGHNFWINSAVMSEDAALLLTASRDHTVKVWRVASGDCELTIGSTWCTDEAQAAHVNFVSMASFLPKVIEVGITPTTNLTILTSEAKLFGKGLSRNSAENIAVAVAWIRWVLLDAEPVLLFDPLFRHLARALDSQRYIPTQVVHRAKMVAATASVNLVEKPIVAHLNFGTASKLLALLCVGFSGRVLASVFRRIFHKSPFRSLRFILPF